MSDTAPAISSGTQAIDAARPARRARYAAWEREKLRQFRQCSVVEWPKVVPGARVITVPGDHPDRIFTPRDTVARATRDSLARCEQVGLTSG